MAILYVRNGASPASPYNSWATAAADLATALNDAACVAGSTIYVAHDHDYNSSAVSITYTSQGTVGNPVRIICVDDAAEPPTTLANTGLERTTGNYGINFGGGYAYIYGMIFTTSSGGGSNSSADMIFGSANADCGWSFEDSNFRILSTSSSAIYQFGSANGVEHTVFWNNCTAEFSSTGQNFGLSRGTWEWKNSNTNAVKGTVPTTQLVVANGVQNYPRVIWDGLDLDQLSPLSYLFSCAGDASQDITVMNCKLGGATPLTGSITGPGTARLRLHNCSGSKGNFDFYEYTYSGYCSHDSNRRLNADFSYKMVPTSAKVAFPFPTLISPPIAQYYSPMGGAITATVEVIHNEAAALKDDEIWLELSYRSNFGDPMAAFGSDRRAIMASAADQPTSTAAWTVSHLLNPIKQKLQVTFTPKSPGYVVAKVYLAKATTNPVYVDPYITIA